MKELTKQMVCKKPRVLIVDDEQVVCNVLDAELSERGYLCTTVLNGNEALAKVAAVQETIDIAWQLGMAEEKAV